MQRKNARVDQRRRPQAAAVIGVAAFIWCAGIAYGITSIHDFESTPGFVGLTPSRWPSDSRIAPAADSATLVMLVHPECSCTAASLSELAAALGKAQGPIQAWVLFVQDAASLHAAGWTDAERIPGVHVGLDPRGAEAIRFGALTSGYVVLYGRDGRLRFSGGITAARGHAGENVGRDQLQDAIAHAAGASPVTHAVFGCALPAASPLPSEPSPSRPPTFPLRRLESAPLPAPSPSLSLSAPSPP